VSFIFEDQSASCFNNLHNINSLQKNLQYVSKKSVLQPSDN